MTPYMSRAVHWMRYEPLVHFFAAGLLLFVFYVAFAPKVEDDGATISISLVQQQNIAALFERTWGRPPTPDEQKSLVAARVREEVLAREAEAMGLSDGDAVVRARLAQKLDFLSDDLAASLDPTEAELQAFLDTNGAKYRTAEKLSLKHVFLKPSADEAADRARVASVLRAVEAGADLAALGDPTLLPAQLTSVSYATLASTFGQAFSDRMMELEPGDWHAPIASPFGHHVVLITAKESGRTPLLPEIRESVVRDWRDTQRLKLRDAFYEDVRARYQVHIEPSSDKHQK